MSYLCMRCYTVYPGKATEAARVALSSSTTVGHLVFTYNCGVMGDAFNFAKAVWKASLPQIDFEPPRDILRAQTEADGWHACQKHVSFRISSVEQKTKATFHR